MKIVISKATVKAITLLTERHGEELVSAKSLTLKAQVPPEVLDEFNAKLRLALFADDIPAFPELGVVELKTEYEGADFTIHGIKCSGAELSKIAFAAMPGYFVDLALTVKVTDYDEEKGGKIDNLLRREVKVTIAKAVQKRIDEGDGGEERDDGQPTLPGVPPTTDGKPITPLLQ